MMETNGTPGETYERFHLLHRILHLVIIFNFTLLAVTGFLLHFSGMGWVSFLVSFFGGAGGMGWLHRFCALFLYLGVWVHLAWILYYKFILNQNLSGPDSILPRKKDFQDLYRNLRYFFNKGTPPRFDRFSYLQKYDYWAELLGMQSMMLTGLMLWFPEFFAAILPGFFINIAGYLHFYEAVLAVMYIGVVHMSDTHLVPDVFPMEKSIFTGRIDKKRFMEEHPEEWKRHQA